MASELHGSVRQWPALDVWTVGIQLIRSADSVGANIAEAYGRHTYPDRLRLVWMARGSAHELQHWIATAHDRGLKLPRASAKRAAELGRMVNGLARAWSGAPRTKD